MKKTLLCEVSIIRPLIIFLLVVYHTLCPFTGGWTPPAGVSENAAYWWLGRLISGFRIETIAFVGGYVFCFQCRELGKRLPLHKFVWKKVRRLVIPCFLFGTAYFLLFRFNPDRFNWNTAFWRVANGIGHLWFLPMLFWCFMAGWIIDRCLSAAESKVESADLKVGRAGRFLIRNVSSILLVVLAGVSLLRLSGLRLGLTRAPYFLFYFYLGYWLRMQGHPDKFQVATSKIQGQEPADTRLVVRQPWNLKLGTWNFKHVLVLVALYFVFLLFHLQATHNQLPGVGFDCPDWMRGWSKLALRLLSLGHTVCGILAVYGAVTLWLRRRRPEGYQPGPFLRMASSYCYGTYVFHMFFLQHLYFGTGFPAWCCSTAVGAWLMPWLSLVMVLVPSLLVTALLLRTRWGRILIG